MKIKLDLAVGRHSQYVHVESRKGAVGAFAGSGNAQAGFDIYASLSLSKAEAKALAWKLLKQANKKAESFQ